MKKSRNKKKKKEALKQLQLMKRKIHEGKKFFKRPDLSKAWKKIETNSWFDINECDQESFGYDINFDIDKLTSDEYKTKKMNFYPNPEQKKILLKWLDCYTEMFNCTTKIFKKETFEREQIKQLLIPLIHEKNEFEKKYMARINRLKNNNTYDPKRNYMGDELIIVNEKIKKLEKELKNRQETYQIFSIGYLKKVLKNDKENIINWSHININGKIISINAHILDYAINDALARYKSCLTNLRNGNIKHFRLRYLKHSKNNKIFKLEKEMFREKSFCIHALGPLIKFDDDDIDLTKIHNISTIHYNVKNNKFQLLIKENVVNLSRTQKYKNKKDIIGLDPGIRKFMSGYSNKKVVKIGENCGRKIKSIFVKIDGINNNKKISRNKKTKLKNKYNEKIKNLVKDLHWKTINYLTKNYKTVLIGNLSTKSTGEGNVNKMTKRIGQALSVFRFRERLKYKCSSTNTSYKLVNEMYTSKCCSNCGNKKENLGGSEIYNCKKCGVIGDRDIHQGAMNITMKSKK